MQWQTFSKWEKITFQKLKKLKTDYRIEKAMLQNSKSWPGFTFRVWKWVVISLASKKMTATAS